MNKLRMRFSKTGRAIYISHLDLMATMQRAFSRAGSRLKYSEGFNPRPQISIALPLSVGCSSVCELMDFQLLEESVDITSLKDRLNATMPEGISVQEIYEPTRKNAELKWLEIEGVFEYDDRQADIMIDGLWGFFARESQRPESDAEPRPALRLAARAGPRTGAGFCQIHPDRDLRRGKQAFPLSFRQKRSCNSAFGMVSYQSL